MKKWISLFVILAIATGIFVYIKCGKDETTVAARHIIHEYGYNKSIYDHTDGLNVFIQYPHFDIPSIDQTISDWAHEKYKEAKSELAQSQQTNADAEVEMHIQYDAYFINDRFVSVVAYIHHQSTVMANPQIDVKIFNVDIASGTFVSNDEIIDETQQNKVVNLLKDKINRHRDLKSATETIDATWLKNIAITHDGLAFIFPKAHFFTSYLGNREITLTYNELGDAYILLSRPIITPTPIPTPTPTPTPTPIEDIPPRQPSGDGQAIALTFDDGPSQYTERILDILKANNSRATFAVLGNRVGSYEQTVQRIIREGSEIMGHSWEHKQLTNLSAEQIKIDLQNTNDAIFRATGIRPIMFRPPYGAYNQTLKDVSKEMGLALINWSVDPEDWKSRNADSVYNAIMSHTHGGSIILCHDIYPSTVEAMERVIPELIARGYRLVTVSELLGTPQAGSVYTGRY
jgi:peptidoglycan/xylan/chitin deacetylase (PgdA/CDA1 family)